MTELDPSRPDAASRSSTASRSRSTPQRERADIVLHRPPFNVISMHARDQLRAAFEALDEDDRVRVIVVRAKGEHFRAAATSRAFWKRRRNTCRSSPGISRRPRAARSR